LSAGDDPAARAASAALKAEALRLGFAAVGIARLDPPDAASPRAAEAGRRLHAWVERGDHGAMHWFERMGEERAHPRALWPGARSLVAVAWNYHRPDEPPGHVAGFARYARGRDYHRAVASRLRALARFARQALPGVEARVAVDTGPLLERPWAETAGVGFVGKHTNLINRAAGNWFLLGELLLDRELAPDAPAERRCGTCRRCLDACPTGAIPEPYRVDARRCISYLTIELRAPIPRELRPLVGERIFGCDDCLDACPWNRFAQAATSDDVRARPFLLATPLTEWLALDEEAFARTFRGTAVLRARRGGFLRNVCIALGNRRDPASVPALAGALDDVDPLVRGAAAWALGAIGGAAARGALEARRAVETDASVLEELARD
jgi:epoxyqueuosine reductase